MFIGDYPNIHDGSLLYLVQLEEGSRMKVNYGSRTVKLVKNWPTRYCCDTSQCFVNHIKVKKKTVLALYMSCQKSQWMQTDAYFHVCNFCEWWPDLKYLHNLNPLKNIVNRGYSGSGVIRGYRDFYTNAVIVLNCTRIAPLTWLYLACHNFAMQSAVLLQSI